MRDLLGGLGEELYSTAKRMRFKTGAIVFEAGSKCPGFVVVQHGRIRVSHLSPTGREVTLYRVGPGDICLQTFSCLMSGDPYGAQGVAESDVDALVLSLTQFDMLMREQPAFRTKVYASISARFADFQETVETLAFAGLASRVAGALLQLETRGVVTATHEILAAEIGSAREAVSRQIAGFSREGWLTQSRGQIQLLEREALQKIRDGS